MDVGARLRSAREKKGLTLENLSRITRVPTSILRAIEANERSAIPPRPYGRGFVRMYAREVGLDPAEMVADYFGQFAPQERAEPQTAMPELRVHLEEDRSSRRVLLVVAAAALLIALAFAIATDRTRRTAREAAGTAGAGMPTATASIGRLPPAAKAPAPVPPAITISLEATSPSWVSAEVDGKRLIFRTIQAGEREVLRGREEIRIRTGNAGGVRWQINGGPARPMGRTGEVRTARVTAAGVLPPSAMR